MNLKDNYILSIKGHKKSNTGYYEEFNSDSSINAELLLQEGKSGRYYGYEIKVIQVFDDYVKLIIDNERIIDLKPGVEEYISYKKDNYGKNENYVIDEEVLYLTLKEIDSNSFKYLFDYVDYLPLIEEGFSNIEHLYKGPKLFYYIYEDLKRKIYKLANEKYINKIIESNDEEAILERNINLRYMDSFNELINNMDEFEKENEKLLDSIIKANIIDDRNFEYIKPYLCFLSDCDSNHDHIPFNKLPKLLNVVRNNCKIESDDDYILLHYYLLKIIMKWRYYFEHAYIAHRVKSNIKNCVLKNFTYTELSEMIHEAGDYFLHMHDRENATDCYDKASDLALKDGNLELAARNLELFYRLYNTLPRVYRRQVDLDYVNNTFKEYAYMVINGIEYQGGLKYDEVENTPEFINAYPKVMRLVEDEIDRVGDLHIPYQRWDLIEKYFLEEFNIKWKNPKIMNPRVMFD